MSDMDDFWVFGYGSLMWRPGFEHVQAERGRLLGYRRALYIHSYVHRGGSCIDMAFRVAGSDREAVMAYLRERELVTNVYLDGICRFICPAASAWKRSAILLTANTNSSPVR